MKITRNFRNGKRTVLFQSSAWKKRTLLSFLLLYRPEYRQRRIRNDTTAWRDPRGQIEKKRFHFYAREVKSLPSYIPTSPFALPARRLVPRWIGKTYPVSSVDVSRHSHPSRQSTLLSPLPPLFHSLSRLSEIPRRSVILRSTFPPSFPERKSSLLSSRRQLSFLLFFFSMCFVLVKFYHHR